MVFHISGNFAPSLLSPAVSFRWGKGKSLAYAPRRGTNLSGKFGEGGRRSVACAHFPESAPPQVLGEMGAQ